MTNTKLAEALRAISLCSQNSASSKDECGRIARQALAAHDAEQAAQAVPAGFVLVPVEFIEAGQRVAQEYARTNPKWPMWDNGEAEPKVQDPCGVHAWLEQAAMLAAATAAPAPEAPPDTDAVTACWQDFGRTEEFRRAVKWLQDGEIPGALFVAFRAGLRAASPKSLCDCGKKPAAECDKWEPGCDLGQSPEHARVVEIDLKPEQAQQSERERFEDWATSYSTFPLERDDHPGLGTTSYVQVEQAMLCDAWQAAVASVLAWLEAVPVPEPGRSFARVMGEPYYSAGQVTMLLSDYRDAMLAAARGNTK